MLPEVVGLKLAGKLAERSELTDRERALYATQGYLIVFASIVFFFDAIVVVNTLLNATRLTGITPELLAYTTTNPKAGPPSLPALGHFHYVWVAAAVATVVGLAERGFALAPTGRLANGEAADPNSITPTSRSWRARSAARRARRSPVRTLQLRTLAVILLAVLAGESSATVVFRQDVFNELSTEYQQQVQQTLPSSNGGANPTSGSTTSATTARSKGASSSAGATDDDPPDVKQAKATLQNLINIRTNAKNEVDCQANGFAYTPLPVLGVRVPSNVKHCKKGNGPALTAAQGDLDAATTAYSSQQPRLTATINAGGARVQNDIAQQDAANRGKLAADRQDVGFGALNAALLTVLKHKPERLLSRVTVLALEALIASLPLMLALAAARTPYNSQQLTRAREDEISNARQLTEAERSFKQAREDAEHSASALRADRAEQAAAQARTQGAAAAVYEAGRDQIATIAARRARRIAEIEEERDVQLARLAAAQKVQDAEREYRVDDDDDETEGQHDGGSEHEPAGESGAVDDDEPQGGKKPRSGAGPATNGPGADFESDGDRPAGRQPPDLSPDAPARETFQKKSFTTADGVVLKVVEQQSNPESKDGVVRAVQDPNGQEYMLKWFTRRQDAYEKELEARPDLGWLGTVNPIVHTGTEDDMPFLTTPRRHGTMITLPPLTLRVALHDFEQVCAGLHSVHARGYAHGDTRPNNLLCDGLGDDATRRTWVNDFGHADTYIRHAGWGPWPVLPTSKNVALEEAVFYNAPERLRGETSSPLSDFFGTGACFYWALCGISPRDDVLIELQETGVTPVERNNALRFNGVAVTALKAQPGYERVQPILDAVTTAVSADAAARSLNPTAPFEEFRERLAQWRGALPAALLDAPLNASVVQLGTHVGVGTGSPDKSGTPERRATP